MDSTPDPRLVRLQILTPLSVLISLGANLVGTLAIKPGAGQINDDFLTILTPRKSLIGAYMLLVFVLQICYCLILVLARKPETKAALLNGVGLRFPLVNAAFALWVVFWDLKIFLASEIALLVEFIVLASIWATLLRHPPSKHRPLDYVFIHAPMTLLLVVLWNVDIWQNGLLALSWWKYVGSEEGVGHGKWEPEHQNHAWIAFGVMTSVGLIDAFIVFLRCDPIWAAGTIYVFLSIILKGNKPAQIFVPLVVLSGLQVVALASSVMWWRYSNAREGAIALPVNEDGEDAQRRHLIADRNGFQADGVPA